MQKKIRKEILQGVQYVKEIDAAKRETLRGDVHEYSNYLVSSRNIET